MHFLMAETKAQSDMRSSGRNKNESTVKVGTMMANSQDSGWRLMHVIDIGAGAL